MCVTESRTELGNYSIDLNNKVELIKPFGTVVILETSISQPSITSLLNRFLGIINSGGATYLAANKYTTKVMWKFASAHFEHTLIETFYTNTLQEFL